MATSNACPTPASSRDAVSIGQIRTAPCLAEALERTSSPNSARCIDFDLEKGWDHTTIMKSSGGLTSPSSSSCCSGGSSSFWIRQHSERSIMQDVAGAMSHITHSESRWDAVQMLSLKDSEEKKPWTISCRTLLWVACLTIVLVTFATQHIPLELLSAAQRHFAAALRTSSDASRARFVERMELRLGANDSSIAEAETAALALELIDDLAGQIEAFDAQEVQRFWTSETVALVALAVTAIAVVALSIAAHIFLSGQVRQLRDLRAIMDTARMAFQTRDEAHEASLFKERSRIREVRDLQDACQRFALVVDRFARFVPEGVVQQIVNGDARASRLHVDRKLVTIVFSDIQDFTSITESLSRRNSRDLLFMLTRYFTVMSHIIETYGGLVGEILGDGILSFWNTPKATPRHQVKAALASLAMVQSLHHLNAEYEMLGLPAVKVRVGIHTGWVLSGNIGSFKKMKFGCIGDPMNVAARLEGLCKHYKVSIICSASTHRAISKKDGIISRQLDRVQVKGKLNSLKIFELMGVEARDDIMASRGSHLTLDMGTVITEAIGKLHADEEAARNLLAATCWDSQYQPERSSPVADSPATGYSRATPRATTPLPPSRGLLLVSPRRKALSSVYEDALTAFQSGRFEIADDLADQILTQAPGDAPAAGLKARAQTKLQEGMTSSEMENWDGVAIMTDK